jgi:hypothetical protein
MLFLKVRGLVVVVVVLCVCAGDFMVVVVIDTVGLSEWLLGTLLAQWLEKVGSEKNVPKYLWWCR